MQRETIQGPAVLSWHVVFFAAFALLVSCLAYWGTQYASTRKSLKTQSLSFDVAEKLGLDSVYCTIGCHPHDYRDFSDEAEKRLRADSWLEVLYVPRCRVAQTCVFQCNVASGNPSVWPKKWWRWASADWTIGRTTTSLSSALGPSPL